jgi:hypothetical protein
MTGSTMKKKEKIPTSGIITIALLLSLVGVSAVWLIIRGHGGALIALVFYSVVSFLCLRSRHFGAGVIAGIFGFGIHIYELFVKGTAELIGIDQVFFYVNLILPIPLTFTSYLASRKEPP